LKYSKIRKSFFFGRDKGQTGIIHSAAIVGAVCLAIAFYALSGLEETFDKDLDYIEE
jgi:predicted anti-sigma-YlaC factor YlaD